MFKALQSVKYNNDSWNHYLLQNRDVTNALKNDVEAFQQHSLPSSQRNQYPKFGGGFYDFHVNKIYIIQYVSS